MCSSHTGQSVTASIWVHSQCASEDAIYTRPIYTISCPGLTAVEEIIHESTVPSLVNEVAIVGHLMHVADWMLCLCQEEPKAIQ